MLGTYSNSSKNKARSNETYSKSIGLADEGLSCFLLELWIWWSCLRKLFENSHWTFDEGLTPTKDEGTCLRRLSIFRKEVH